MLEALTAKQFAEWAEFYSLEPWGLMIDDARAGMFGAFIAAFAGAKEMTPGMFMIRPPPETLPTLAEEQIEALMKIFDPARFVQNGDAPSSPPPMVDST